MALSEISHSYYVFSTPFADVRPVSSHSRPNGSGQKFSDVFAASPLSGVHSGTASDFIMRTLIMDFREHTKKKLDDILKFSVVRFCFELSLVSHLSPLFRPLLRSFPLISLTTSV